MNVASQIEAPRADALPGAEPLDPALERVLLRVRLRAQRRVAWLRKLWSEEEPPGGHFAVTHGEVDTHLLDNDSPAAEAAWVASDPLAVHLTAEIEGLEREIAADEESRLARLQRIFDLTAEDRDILQACLAVSLDPSLARVYAYIQDVAARGYATEELIGRLFDHGRRAVLKPASPLRLWRLVAERETAPGEPRMLACDPAMRGWLCGRNELDQHLHGIARMREPMAPLENWPVGETADWLKGLMAEGTPARVRIVGPVGSGRRTLAANISGELGLRLLAIDTDSVADLEWTEVYIRAQRHALLNDCALAWHGERASDRPWPSAVSASPVQFVICEPAQHPLPLKDAVEHQIEMPLPTLEERRRLWHRHVPASLTWEEELAEALFARTTATPGTIADVGRSAVPTADAAARKVREGVRCRLGQLIEAIECPFDWDDLVVPDHVRLVLEDFVFEARERADFWEAPHRRRLFPQGRGLFALLAGSPGVGKTMSAQVIARAVNRELYRIDVSRVVSKYVGETSKNLQRILSSVPTDEVLLFDEADALFGRRPDETRDAHDRYAVQESSTLLMAIEGAVEGRGANSFGPGTVALLATNRKNAIDPAFIRRLRYVIDIPKPDAALRLKLWKRLLGELAGPSALSAVSGGLQGISQEVETTPAQIKFAVLSALFAARRKGESLGMKHLLHGLERELRKDGHGWSARERERLMRHGG